MFTLQTITKAFADSSSHGNIRSVVDSVTRNGILDTTGKTEIEKTLITRLKDSKSLSAEELIGELFDKVIVFGLKILAALLIYFVGAYLIKVFKRFLRSVFERRRTEPAIVSFVMSLVSTVCWVLLVVIVVGTLGIETTSIAALLAAGGMAIGMALSGTVQNFAGGVMILVFKPFKVGDYIETQGYAGTVTEMNITSTKLLTTDNRVIVLPNGSLSSGTVNNYSSMQLRRVDISVSVEYGSDAARVRELLLDIAAKDSRVLTVATGAPADPFAALHTLASSSVDFVFRVWVGTADYWPVYFDLNEKIYTSFPENGIGFPFPQLTVHMPSQKDNIS